MDLSACAAMCSANATCHCFDHKGGPDSSAAAGDSHQCRLHVDAGGLTSSGEFSAYWKNTTAAELALAAREAQDTRHEERLAAANRGGAAADSGGAGGCNVCTEAYPCLFDLSTDEQERHNLASAQPELVKQMLAQKATYSAYFGTPMDPKVLAAKYDCPDDVRPWYGNFSGPCCRPKAQQ